MPRHIPSHRVARVSASRTTPTLPSQAAARARAAVSRSRSVPMVDARNFTRLPGVPDPRSTGRRRGR